MAKRRLLNTKFWSDNYVSNLDPSEKLLFIYLLTNPYTNISGAYEISIKQIALDTGFDKEMVEKILRRFSLDKKIFYLKGYIIVKNFIKHQELNPKVLKGVENEARNLPESIKKIVYDSLSHLNLNSNINILGETSSPVSKKNMRTYNENNHSDDDLPSMDIDSGEYITPKKPSTKKYPNAKSVFNLFGNYPKNWIINKTQLQAAENLFLERGLEQIIKALEFYKENQDKEFCPLITSPYDLDSKWSKLFSFKTRK